MKALIVASVASMIDQFNMDNIALLQQSSYEVHVGCNFNHPGNISKERCEKLKKILEDMNVSYFQLDFSRSIFNVFSNVKTLKQIKNLFKTYNYDLVHLHSPIGGLLGRIAAKKYRKKANTKVIYTAHGFHFYKGAPIKNWLVYYPIEKFCSFGTDCLITINKEDYEFAKKKMRAKSTCYIPGIGIDIEKINNITVDKKKKREELGIPQDAKMILSVGELNRNKNHKLVIKALRMINNPNIHYVIVGIGCKRNKLEKMANKLGVNLHLLGYRTDCFELYKVSDLFVIPSLREGLNVSLMEAIASKLPVIASKIRGNVDLVPLNNCFNPRKVLELTNLLKKDEIKNECDINIFGKQNVNNHMKEIYKNISN